MTSEAVWTLERKRHLAGHSFYITLPRSLESKDPLRSPLRLFVYRQKKMGASQSRTTESEDKVFFSETPIQVRTMYNTSSFPFFFNSVVRPRRDTFTEQRKCILVLRRSCQSTYRSCLYNRTIPRTSNLNRLTRPFSNPS